MICRKPILVTGSHRSGSTWTGQMIALCPEVKYTYEPFNIGTEDPKPIVNWFEYVNTHLDRKHAAVVAKYIHYKLGITLKTLKHVRSVRDIYEFMWMIKETCSRRPLMKDPIAIMSADWLFETFKMDVIVMIRHPAAFVASLKLKNWQFDFNHLSGQEGLMNIIPDDLSEKIKAYTSDLPGIIDQGILLWNIIHYRISQYKKQFPSWMFVTHEELSNEPIDGFQEIYKYLGLQYTDEIKNNIMKSTNPEQESNFRRNSKSNVLSWKKRLNEDEIDRIQQGTKDISSEFYDSCHW